jgi:hypothetical protein
MSNNLIRTWLYLVSGLISALIGWNIGQVFLTDFGWKQFPEVILFPCVATSLAVGMSITEIFLSNPTRFKLSLRTAKESLKWAIPLGLFSGIISGGICQILLQPAFRIPPIMVRIFGWLLIGGFAGLAEGFTWRQRSIEAGNKERADNRLRASAFGGLGASLMAAVLFEFIRNNIGAQLPGLQNYEDPMGFGILGLCLGFVFSCTSSPSYLVALRAGGGFEFTGDNYGDLGSDDDDLSVSPSIKQDPDDKIRLSFINNSEMVIIEEGLSIQLPSAGKIHIGSAAPKSHIRIPALPLHVADLELKGRETILRPNGKFFGTIEINGQKLFSKSSVALKHNNVITFYTVQNNAINPKKFYRFVYYNRFLDPQA